MVGQTDIESTHLISANEQLVLVLVGHLQLYRALEVGRPRRIAAEG